MEPLLKQQGANIIFKKIIEKMPTGDINVFLAHGTTDLDRFKYFQADDNSFHYRTDIFGNGAIAILFICSSGNLHEDFLSQDIRSIGQDLILKGYSSVIAPFWKYDVTIAKIWLTEFFKVFKVRYSIMELLTLPIERLLNTIRKHKECLWNRQDRPLCIYLVIRIFTM